MVPDRRHSIARAAFKADLMEEIDPSIFDYQTKRETGLIPQNEETHWGHEDSRQRHETSNRYNNRYVAQSFFKVDWAKGSTGRGLDFRYGDYILEGPKGEVLEHAADAQAPTLPETRRLWRMVDQGDDESVDPLYDGLPIDWDEDKSWSEDEEVAPISQTKVNDEISPVTDSQQHAQLNASGEKLENLQDVAAQAFLMVQGNDLEPFNGTRQVAELDPPGEMRDVLRQRVDERSQSPDEYQATTDVPASLESSPESTEHLGKKREWTSLGKDGHGVSEEGLDNGRSRSLKCLRIWYADKADTLGEVHDIFGDMFGGDSSTEASLSKQKRSPILQADEKNTLLEIEESLRNKDSQDSRVPSDACVTSEAKSSIGYESGASRLLVTLQKRKGNPIHNNLVDTVTEVRQTPMKIAKRKVQGSRDSNEAIGAGHENGRCYRFLKDTGGNAMSSNLKGMERWRGIPLARLDEGESSDGEWQLQHKRQRVSYEQPIEARRTVGQGSVVSDNFKADNSSDCVGSSETDASSIDSGLRKAQPDQALGPVKIRARPTFYGISPQMNKVTKKTEWVPDDNEAEDIVVTHVRKSQPQAYDYSPGLTPRIEPKSRPWTEGEDEDLRSWVQDYGMQENWSEIAWCLHRSEDGCQKRYGEIVVARNKRAGRDPQAGLAGWVDHELEVTPEEIAELVAEDLARHEAAT